MIFFGKNTQYQDQAGMIFFEKYPILRPGWYEFKKKNPIPRPRWYEFLKKYPIPRPGWYELKKKKPNTKTRVV
jgi:hypothetical protein